MDGSDGGGAPVRPSAEQARDALSAVVDPELGLPITDLGLVYDVQVDDDGVVKVVYTLTTVGCPIGPMIEQQMRQILATLPGVASVEATMVFSPPWTPDLMSEDARAALGIF
ncbi:MAG: metal-sulfur cluster assembly factor [Acidobacteria bacterium]|nr:metal-sulfur cluster assembly factor [Acidobacteriota bacterium]